MKYPKYLHGAFLDTKAKDVAVAGNDKFSRDCNSSSTSYIRTFLQLLGAGEILHEESFGIGGAFSSALTMALLTWRPGAE